MLLNSRNKIKIQNFPSGICLTPMSQQAISFKNKKFARKRQNSSDSLSGSRISNHRGLQSDRDNRNTKLELDKKGCQTQRKDQILSFIKNTAYIKPRNQSFTTNTDNLQSRHFSRQNTSNCSSRKLKGAHEQNKTTIGREKRENYQKPNNQFSHPITIKQKNYAETFIDNNDAVCKKLRFFDDCERLSTISNCFQSSDYQLQLQIKSKELMILEDQNIRLKSSQQNKIKQISRLQGQRQTLRIENSQLKKQIRQSTVNAYQILNKYSLTHSQQYKKFENNLSGFLAQNLQQTIQSYINKLKLSYESIIDDLQQKLYNEKVLVDKLLVKTNFYDKFRSQNTQLKNINTRMHEELNRMKKRNDYLVDENTTLRVSNSKIRKSITQLKKLYNQKQKESKAAKCDKQKQKQINKQQNIEFSFVKQPMIQHIRIKDESNRKILDDFDAITQSDNSNNLSMNISDVSTEQLMELEDFL